MGSRLPGRGARHSETPGNRVIAPAAARERLARILCLDGQGTDFPVVLMLRLMVAKGLTSTQIIDAFWICLDIPRNVRPPHFFTAPRALCREPNGSRPGSATRCYQLFTSILLTTCLTPFTFSAS